MDVGAVSCSDCDVSDQRVDRQHGSGVKLLPPVPSVANGAGVERIPTGPSPQMSWAMQTSILSPGGSAGGPDVIAVQATEPVPPAPGAPPGKSILSPGGTVGAGGTPQAAAPPLSPASAARPGNGQQPEVLAPVAAGGEGALRSAGPFEILDQAEDLSVIMRRSKLLRSKVDISRVAVVDSNICDVVQFSPREASIIGKSQGATNVTFWFQDPNAAPRTFLVKVTPDVEVRHRREQMYDLFETTIAKLFPNSKVKLTPVGDKLLVTGQARDAAEAAQIMVLIRGEATDQQGGWPGGRLVEGTTTGLYTSDEVGKAFPASQVINLLRIPGVQQVALRVKIAELNRTAAREFGVDLDMTLAWNDGAIFIKSLLNAGSDRSILGTFSQNNLNFGIHYLEQHGVIRMLSEPTLVTLSGRPASFVAGGEFAVPTVVGVQGASAVTTDFRAFGALITFTPVVLDKDHIRLMVSPEFSQIDTSLAVGGTPGLDTRAVTTTVEMREGQTLAIAGLLDESMKNGITSDLPVVGQLFGSRQNTRHETELIILVSPELVHPMDPEEVPPLPGFDVTEPNNTQFFVKGEIEGRPTEEYRSTVWPMLRHRYNSGGAAMISGPYGHCD
jgi:pilus assembly protein CpaC